MYIFLFVISIIMFISWILLITKEIKDFIIVSRYDKTAKKLYIPLIILTICLWFAGNIPNIIRLYFIIWG